MERAGRRRLNPKDYTVVWLAPLLIEAKACYGVLDEIHKGYFEIQEGQDYNFSGGSLNGHNIIVATFPRGENYGPVSAAALVKEVKMIFPAQYVLLVGVAAGIPRLGSTDPKENKDIRLGDVLVAVPDKERTGVVAYASGTQTDDEFRVTSRQIETMRIFRSTYNLIELSVPPPFAVGGDFGPYLQEAQAKLKEMFPDDDFSHPSWSEDTLYQYTNNNDLAGSQVNREPRAAPERPRVWYGEIGSDNKLMRSHLERDSLRDKHNLIGLEMEAAGVMNFSQAAVIRGVCDYGDKKKNKKWQGYAAVVAAVYAKGVLMLINPARIEATQQLGRNPLGSPETVAMHGENHREDSTGGSKQQDEFSNAAVNSKEGKAVLKWLSEHSYVERYEQCLANHQPGTVSWVFEADEYHNWRRGNAKCLLFKGHPGAGKSTITALVARQAQEDGHAIAVVFFSRDTDGKSYELVHYLSAIVRQLIERSDRIPKVALQTYRTCLEDKRPFTKRDISTILESVIKRTEKICFVIDALDECKVQQQRLNLLMQLSELQGSFPHIKIVMSSRKIDYILDVVSRTFPGIQTIDVKASEPDLEAYIDEQFRVRAQLQTAQLHKGLVEKLKRRLMHNLDGMFLLVVLRCQFLDDQGSRTPAEFIASTTEICEAQTLRDTYFAMWRQILRQDYDQVEMARRVFTWVCFSVGPLNINQLQHALASQASLVPTRISNNHLFHQAIITRPCLGLLVITGNGVVGFMHITASEIFPQILRHWWYGVRNPQMQMCRTCLRYLGQKDLEPCVTDDQMAQRLIDFPFLSYAVRAWSEHATLAEKNFRQRGLLRWLLDTDSVERAARLAAFMDHTRVLVLPRSEIPTNISAQHLLAFFGMADVLSHLLRWGLHCSPLQTDEWYAMLQALALLLTTDILIAVLLRTVKYSLLTNNAWTVAIAFVAAACATLLADKSVRPASINPDPRDGNGWTPLRYAAWRGHLNIMRSLTSAGTDLDARDARGDTTLMWALGERTTSRTLHPTRTISSSGEVRLHIGSTYKLPACAAYPEWIMPSPARVPDAMITELIRSSKNIDIRNEQGRTPLIQAANSRQFRHVQMLLDHGADIELTDTSGMTALLAAVKCLLEEYEVPRMELHGTDSMHIGDYIILDAEHDQEEEEDLKGDTIDIIIRRLMGQRIVNVQDQWGRTALAYAMANGQRQVVKDLLANGADTNCLDDTGKTPLMWALSRTAGRRILTQNIDLYGNSRMSQGLFFELRGRLAARALLDAVSDTRSNFVSLPGISNAEHAGITRDRTIGAATASSDAEAVEPWRTRDSTSQASNMRDDPDISSYHPRPTQNPPELNVGRDYEEAYTPWRHDMESRLNTRGTSPGGISHSYGDLEQHDQGTVIDGDMVLGSNMPVDFLGQLTSVLAHSRISFASLDSHAGTTIHVRDRACVIRGNLFGDENCPLDAIWSKSKLARMANRSL